MGIKKLGPQAKALEANKITKAEAKEVKGDKEGAKAKFKSSIFEESLQKTEINKEVKMPPKPDEGTPKTMDIKS